MHDITNGILDSISQNVHLHSPSEQQKPKFYSVKLFTDSAVHYHWAMNKLDHIVIAAETLELGVDYINSKLGVAIPVGGQHQTMGTHNHLMQLGNEAYLEVISINPQADTPPHPRWFALDQAMMRESLKRGPRLITWVMNCGNIGQLIEAVDFDIGEATALTRNNLSWEIALPDDGRLLNGGLLPYSIQWHSSPHPSQGMADLGCSLQSLTLHHNRPEWLSAKLEMLGASHLVKVETLTDSESPYLSASIRTAENIDITLP